jgi:hypothetical protein
VEGLILGAEHVGHWLKIKNDLNIGVMGLSSKDNMMYMELSAVDPGEFMVKANSPYPIMEVRRQPSPGGCLSLGATWLLVTRQRAPRHSQGILFPVCKYIKVKDLINIDIG